MLKIGIITGSTRPNRFADVPARWLTEIAPRASSTLKACEHFSPWS